MVDCVDGVANHGRDDVVEASRDTPLSKRRQGRIGCGNLRCLLGIDTSLVFMADVDDRHGDEDVDQSVPLMTPPRRRVLLRLGNHRCRVPRT